MSTSRRGSCIGPTNFMISSATSILGIGEPEGAHSSPRSANLSAAASSARFAGFVSGALHCDAHMCGRSQKAPRGPEGLRSPKRAQSGRQEAQRGPEEGSVCFLSRAF